MAIKTGDAINIITSARELLPLLPSQQCYIVGELKRAACALLDDRQKYLTLYFFELLKSAKKVKDANISVFNSQSLTANFQHLPDLSANDVCMCAAKEFAKVYLDSGVEGIAFSAFKKTVNVKHLGCLSTIFTIICTNNG